MQFPPGRPGKRAGLPSAPHQGREPVCVPKTRLPHPGTKEPMGVPAAPRSIPPWDCLKRGQGAQMPKAKAEAGSSVVVSAGPLQQKKEPKEKDEPM